MFYPYLICHTDFDTDLMGMAIDLEHTQDIPGPYTDRYMETGLKLFLLRLLHRLGYIDLKGTGYVRE